MHPWHSLSEHERSLRARLANGQEIRLEEFSRLDELRRAPMNPESLLYRLYAHALMLQGRTQEAIDLYVPFIAAAVRRPGPRPIWYLWTQVESAPGAAGQSQRFSQSAEEIDQEWVRIAEALQLGPGDRVLDVGAAGGLFTLRIAPLVAHVVATDVSEKLVAAAEARLAAFGNVRCLQHDVTAEALPEVFDKALMSGVTPVLPGPDKFAAALRNLAAMLCCGGKCLISNSYDAGSAGDAARHMLTDGANWRRMSIFESMLWLDPAAACESARAVGFASAEVCNARMEVDQRRMFDLLLVR